MHAVAARDYLVQNGVPAQVVGGNTDSAMSWGRNGGAYEVVLAARDDVELANFLLEQWTNEPVELQGDLDDHALPDLSVLDAGLAPPCPNCGQTLPLDAAVQACPACGAAVDVAALIVQEHGPEVLDACYDASPSSDELMGFASDDQPCPACGGRINDAGRCSGCGRRRA
jgi:hypothetical protein